MRFPSPTRLLTSHWWRERFPSMKSILFVDDDPLWLELIVPEFKALGYEVSSCTTPREGEKMILSCRPRVAVIDQVMHPTSGCELIERIQRVVPLQRFILVSAHDATALTLPHGVPYVFKDIRCVYDTLRQEVQRVIGPAYEQGTTGRGHGLSRLAAVACRAAAGLAAIGR